MKRDVLNRLLASCAFGLMLLPFSGGTAAACSEDQYLGSLCMTAARTCPRGFLPATGQMLPITPFQSLYSLLGCAWGGDCKNTFALPNMRGRAPVGYGKAPGLSEIGFAQYVGKESANLLVPLPEHSHGANFVPHGETPVDGTLTAFDTGATSASPTPGAFISGGGTDLKFGTGGFGTQSVEVGGLTIVGGIPSGSVKVYKEGVPEATLTVPLRNPVAGVTYCISTQGVYPPRPESQ
ncbi:phage tail protein [Nisaea sp.]|uniref:phage tail protein n=1 Tax=Nisaea sp. TaxID=2024842 RepID=UPI003B525691